MDQHVLAERLGCDQGNQCACRPARESEVGEYPTRLMDMSGTGFADGEYWCPACEFDMA